MDIVKKRYNERELKLKAYSDEMKYRLRETERNADREKIKNIREKEGMTERDTD